MRPVTIWKGNSFTTISARDPHISGKDSGKGDSDFNDSDSDISADVHKKESPPTNSELRRQRWRESESASGANGGTQREIVAAVKGSETKTL